MVAREKLLNYCNTLLSPSDFKDYCPNGLQIEGVTDIHRIVSGVTACGPLIDRAIALQADVLLVHHGFFWKNEPDPIIGMKHDRIKALLTQDVNLIAYHLPLDAHQELGNNIQLANRLNIQVQGYFGEQQLALWGSIPPESTEHFIERLHRQLDRMPLHVGPTSTIQTVGLCTGAAQSYITAATELGLDAFISGEISETTYHIATESPIAYFAAGHHASERYGVQALGEHLANQFDLIHTFVDITNPV